MAFGSIPCFWYPLDRHGWMAIDIRISRTRLRDSWTFIYQPCDRIPYRKMLYYHSDPSIETPGGEVLHNYNLFPSHTTLPELIHQNWADNDKNKIKWSQLGILLQQPGLLCLFSSAATTRKPNNNYHRYASLDLKSHWHYDSLPASAYNRHINVYSRRSIWFPAKYRYLLAPRTRNFFPYMINRILPRSMTVRITLNVI